MKLQISTNRKNPSVHNHNRHSLFSSFPLAFPVIWGCRYGCRSSLSSKPCLLHRPLSVLQSACPSCTHPSTLSFGLPLFLFPGITFVITLLTIDKVILLICEILKKSLSQVPVFNLYHHHLG